MRRIVYNKVQYPLWAVGIGWASFASSVSCIPLYILYIIISKRDNISGNLRKRLSPLDWTPADPKDRAEYLEFRRQRNMPAFMSDTDME